MQQGNWRYYLLDAEQSRRRSKWDLTRPSSWLFCASLDIEAVANDEIVSNLTGFGFGGARLRLSELSVSLSLSLRSTSLSSLSSLRTDPCCCRHFYSLAVWHRHTLGEQIPSGRPHRDLGKKSSHPEGKDKNADLLSEVVFSIFHLSKLIVKYHFTSE